ncbi:MAG: hypothetical protein EAZ31_08630 [Cytophagia bacterium]|nr:MAG: hypothetical protein EAZ31_08630 [Cytophagia bacterium]
MENQEIKSYNFSTIKFSDLQKIIKIRPELTKDQFKEWFSFPYKLIRKESLFLKELIDRHITLLNFYMEEDLKMKFLSPIFNQVNFTTDRFHDWYDGSLSGMVNGVEIKGFADFMVATGFDEAQKPYFFIQEFKPSVPDRNPEVQLLAEMLVTIEKNKTNIMRGGYIIGQYWKFVILEKIAENQFEYFVSKSFDSLDLSDLKQIYIILQAVKHKYCKD